METWTRDKHTIFLNQSPNSNPINVIRFESSDKEAVSIQTTRLICSDENQSQNVKSVTWHVSSNRVVVVWRDIVGSVVKCRGHALNHVTRVLITWLGHVTRTAPLLCSTQTRGLSWSVIVFSGQRTFGPAALGPAVFGPAAFGPEVFGPPSSRATVQSGQWAAPHKCWINHSISLS